MQSATQLFSAHLALLTGEPEQWRQLYADDAVMEFPYAPTIGAPARYEGVEAIFNHVQGVFAQLSNPVFDNISIQPLATPQLGKEEAPEEEAEERVVAEFEIAAVVKNTGRPYNQKYIALMTARRGKIVFLREYWNPQEVIKSFAALPGV
jgi:ketosteroid isomerase-like protein